MYTYGAKLATPSETEHIQKENSEPMTLASAASSSVNYRILRTPIPGQVLLLCPEGSTGRGHSPREIVC